MLLQDGDVGGRVKRARGIKEGTCDEHRVLYADEESLNPTPEASITRQVN